MRSCLVDWGLASSPTVTCLVPGICSSINSAASRSAVPLASNTSVFTISPWRFSTRFVRFACKEVSTELH